MNGIIRVRRKHYTVLSPILTGDKKLSFAARGMMAYLLSKPDDWQARVSDLINQSPASKDAVRSIINELIKHRYMKHTRKRRDDGTFDYETEVFEEPFASEDEPAKEVSTR